MTCRIAAIGLAVCVLGACSEQPEPAGPSSAGGKTVFRHDVASGPRPWTDREFAYDSDTVRFAVFSDLTPGERSGVFDIAVEQLNLLRPELIVNVGNLIEGGSERSAIDRQWDAFESRASRANAPVFYTGGNLDLLGEEMRRAWEDRIGPRYYHFLYRDVLFLVLDTDDHSPERFREIEALRKEAMQIAMTRGYEATRNSKYTNLPEDEAGMISQAQADYVVRALGDNPDVRWTFVLMHKAPWKNPEMRTWQFIERALGDRPYTVFHGHRHAYKHEERNGRDYIRLATTGGIFLAANGLAVDQLVWVTVDDEGAHIANLQMSGIRDATGRVPRNGDNVCLEVVDCYN